MMGTSATVRRNAGRALPYGWLPLGEASRTFLTGRDLVGSITIEPFFLFLFPRTSAASSERPRGYVYKRR